MKLANIVFRDPVPRPGTSQDLASIARSDDKNDIHFEQGIVTWRNDKGTRLVPVSNAVHMEPVPAPKK